MFSVTKQTPVSDKYCGSTQISGHISVGIGTREKI